ncbi:MAG: bifunctional phosphopantothenoylcysteine decarboxylase/phosphopantothenate--cysteine ligase CoaBC, partial [Pseudomonadota bacterium]
LCEQPVRQDLFALEDESKMGHIALARRADIIAVIPASADFLARMRLGLCSDLATTLILAASCPILVAPAMNPQMWAHPATQDTMSVLYQRGVKIIQPDHGETACGETGEGRLADLATIVNAIEAADNRQSEPKPLAGMRLLVTAGPTHEPIDPVRMIANRSSGLQGYSIARALIEDGADVILISGPVALPPPPGCDTVFVETAQAMADAVDAIDGAIDGAICTAAVSDWRLRNPHTTKLKKQANPGKNQAGLTLDLVENPDILMGLNKRNPRPKLIIGFAAETGDAVAQAREKRLRKGCDWIIANDVAKYAFGSTLTQLTILRDRETVWPAMTKMQAAQKLARLIARHFSQLDQA